METKINAKIITKCDEILAVIDIMSKDIPTENHARSRLLSILIAGVSERYQKIICANLPSCNRT